MGEMTPKPCVWIKDGDQMPSFDSAGTAGTNKGLLSSHLSGERCWGMLYETFGCPGLFWKGLENPKRGNNQQVVLAWVEKVRRWKRRCLGRKKVYAIGRTSAGGRSGVGGLWSL